MCWFCCKKKEQQDRNNQFFLILKQKQTYNQQKNNQTRKKFIKIKIENNQSQQTLLRKKIFVIEDGDQVTIIQTVQKNRNGDFVLQHDGDLQDQIKKQLVYFYRQGIEVIFIEQPQKTIIKKQILYQQVIKGILCAESTIEFQMREKSNKMINHRKIRVIVYWKDLSDSKRQQLISKARNS